jgi:hypothetical protein
MIFRRLGADPADTQRSQQGLRRLWRGWRVTSRPCRRALPTTGAAGGSVAAPGRDDASQGDTEDRVPPGDGTRLPPRNESLSMPLGVLQVCPTCSPDRCSRRCGPIRTARSSRSDRGRSRVWSSPRPSAGSTPIELAGREAGSGTRIQGGQAIGQVDSHRVSTPVDDHWKGVIAMPAPAPPPLQVLDLAHYLRHRIAHTGQRSKD